ncbi:Ulp1 protease family protein [Coccidioides immitis RMSCC 3703]|uniref:Ulp1 protease family protein n=1 Tax=Coccidioides immitis RMSCC 3703 TaxID=454286 RepID=A0A0J8QUX4_COCIT|nr:Ulp1 protease family protein [Coccidioides immitis RMSCC 3703]
MILGRFWMCIGVGSAADLMQASPDDTYVTYYDISLTNEDVDTLKNDWLTDNVIAFWEEYLEREVISHYQTTRIILLRPSMSYLLYQTPDPRSLRGALPEFSRASHIFLPINDCRSVTEAEGEHIGPYFWSPSSITLRFTTILSRQEIGMKPSELHKRSVSFSIADSGSSN